MLPKKAKGKLLKGPSLECLRDNAKEGSPFLSPNSNKMKMNHLLSSRVNKCLLIVCMSDCLLASPFFSLAQMLAATLMIAAKTTLCEHPMM